MMLVSHHLIFSILFAVTCNLHALKLSRHGVQHVQQYFSSFTKVLAVATVLNLPIDSCSAVSGGGKDYATKDIRGEDFSGQALISKDFTQCDGTGTNFRKAVLKGSRFYRANLKDADFSGANLEGVSLEDTSLLDTIFTDADLQGAYFSAGLTEAKSITNADFTDAQMPTMTQKTLCGRPDAMGTNPTTGVDTRESLLCE